MRQSALRQKGSAVEISAEPVTTPRLFKPLGLGTHMQLIPWAAPAASELFEKHQVTEHPQSGIPRHGGLFVSSALRQLALQFHSPWVAQKG